MYCIVIVIVLPVSALFPGKEQNILVQPIFLKFEQPLTFGFPKKPN